MTSPDARILAAAADFLRRVGPARATIVQIAEAAGMSHANVYRYFPSKAALIEEVTAAWLRPVEAEARAIADGPDPAPDKLERLLFAIHRAYRDKLESDPKLFAILADAATANEGVARKHRARLQAIVQRVVEEGLAQGAFPGADLRRSMETLFDLCHRFLHPVAVQLDRELSRAAVAARAGRAARLALRSLARGVGGGDRLQKS
jgi:AcrR family transcriptional regulator